MPLIMQETETTLFVWWKGGPTGADVEQILGHLESEARAGRRKHYVCVVSGLARPPTADGRDAFIRDSDRAMRITSSFHLVLGTSPFLNSIARGLMATAGIMRRHPGHIFLHDHIDQAIVAVHAETRDAALLRVDSPAGAA